MEYISAKEAAYKWGISQRRVSTLCSEHRIENAAMVGNMWIIPSNAEKPTDARTIKNDKAESREMKPFLKWAGGKTQLLSEIRKLYPFDNFNIKKYAEPFIGGGAVLFDILNKYDLEEIYISDVNLELVNVYKIIRDNIDELIFLLKLYQREYIPLCNEERRKYYLTKRDRFNDLKIEYNDSDNIEKAALLVFLNKTCFNGLYRVNKKGLFNVPMGSYKSPVICDEYNLRLVSSKLKNVKIIHGTYSESQDFIDENTFVYIDPPYRPLTNTAMFTSYTENEFNDNEQIKLSEFIDKINNKHAKIVLSNSDPKNIDENDNFFDDLYAKYKISRVQATRMINSKSSGRGKICELLISNF